jgi:hypothetical protein
METLALLGLTAALNSNPAAACMVDQNMPGKPVVACYRDLSECESEVSVYLMLSDDHGSPICFLARRVGL